MFRRGKLHESLSWSVGGRNQELEGRLARISGRNVTHFQCKVKKKVLFREGGAGVRSDVVQREPDRCQDPVDEWAESHSWIHPVDWIPMKSRNLVRKRMESIGRFEVSSGVAEGAVYH